MGPAAVHQLDDRRVSGLRPLIPPAILLEEVPPTEAASATVEGGRAAIEHILAGEDDRLLVVVGPCSIHDPVAGLDYARRLARVAERVAGDLCIVMRVYFEKPRSRVGWKGLINDPHLDGSFAVNEGLRLARRFLRDVLELGLPTGCEFLDPVVPQFIADLVAWGAIGARTSESQVHRELASGLSMPVGFKNTTDGSVGVAIDAIRAASHPHHFLGVTKQGLAAIVGTTGNQQCHLILRGGDRAPNYSTSDVGAAAAALEEAGLAGRLMVDCSHANSRKNPRRQAAVAAELAQRIAEGESKIFGLMMESFLVDGRQNLEAGGSLVYGRSITDACMSWEDTEPLLETLATAVAARRRARSTPAS